MSTMTAVHTLKACFTPDPDDAFAWWAIATGKLKIADCEVETSLRHIQEINAACQRGEYDIAAVSSAAWPRLCDDYYILESGASVGRNYGPALASKNLREEDLNENAVVGIPGELTTGALLLRIFYPKVKTVSLPFDRVAPAILAGELDAGVLIHEELLNWKAAGLKRLACLGEKWGQHTGLPLTVGLNIVHRRVGLELAHEISAAIRESMLLAQRHEAEALAWAMRYSRQAEPEIGPKFVSMFANEDTLRMDDDCRTALRRLFELSAERGLLARIPAITYV